MPLAINITNHRFGKLTAKSVTRQNDLRAWVCVCDCGNEITSFANVLRSGGLKSCGCAAHWSKGPLREPTCKKLKGLKRSEETKQKLREVKRTPEWRAKTSAGIKRAMAAGFYTLELRRKRSLQMKTQPGRNLGRKWSPEARQRMSLSQKGKVFSVSHRIALSEAGKGHPFRGKNNQFKGGYYQQKCGVKIWMQSSYELKVAEFLDAINEPWVYVTYDKEHSFLLQDLRRRYYPDFYIPRLGIYIDPKGYDRAPEKRKHIERMYPGKVRFLVGGNYLNQLSTIICLS